MKPSYYAQAVKNMASIGVPVIEQPSLFTEVEEVEYAEATP